MMSLPSNVTERDKKKNWFTVEYLLPSVSRAKGGITVEAGQSLGHGPTQCHSGGNAQLCPTLFCSLYHLTDCPQMALHRLFLACCLISRSTTEKWNLNIGLKNTFRQPVAPSHTGDYLSWMCTPYSCPGARMCLVTMATREGNA